MVYFCATKSTVRKLSWLCLSRIGMHDLVLFDVRVVFLTPGGNCLENLLSKLRRETPIVYKLQQCCGEASEQTELT